MNELANADRFSSDRSVAVESLDEPERLLPILPTMRDVVHAGHRMAPIGNALSSLRDGEPNESRCHTDGYVHSFAIDDGDSCQSLKDCRTRLSLFPCLYQQLHLDVHSCCGENFDKQNTEKRRTAHTYMNSDNTAESSDALLLRAVPRPAYSGRYEGNA